MDRTHAIARLPRAYARALALRAQGVDEEGIAADLGIARQAVGVLLRLADAKLASLLDEQLY